MATTIQVERLSELISAAAAVVGEVDLDRVLRRLISEARQATGARYAALGVIGAHGVLTEFIHEGMDDEDVKKVGSLPQGRGVLGAVVRDKKSIVVDDISQHPDSYGFPEHHPKMTSFLGVPIRAGSSTYGNLYLTDKPGGFTSADVELVEALATVAGAAINTARLRERLETMAIVEDRDRIARDLHDSIIQDLFAIGLSLQGLADRIQDEASSAILNDSVDRLDDAVEALRKYIYELKSSDDYRRGLPSQLTELVERMSSAYPVAVDLDTSDDLDPVDPLVTDELIKLATEALSNALRHSKASTVTVRVGQEGRALVLSIGDDGVGFDPDGVAHGLGLRNMQDRARRLGGDIEIRTGEGEGTEVVIRLPQL